MSLRISASSRSAHGGGAGRARVRAIQELRRLEPATLLDRDMLGEVEGMTPEALLQEVTEWLPDVHAAAAMIPPVREPSDDDDERLAALVEKMRPDRRQLSWRQRRKLPKTSAALSQLAEATVAAELDQAVGDALAERAPEIAARWVKQGVAEAENAANLGASQRPPAASARPISPSMPGEPQAAAGSLLWSAIRSLPASRTCRRGSTRRRAGARPFGASGRDRRDAACSASARLLGWRTDAAAFPSARKR